MKASYMKETASIKQAYKIPAHMIIFSLYENNSYDNRLYENRLYEIIFKKKVIRKQVYVCQV